MKKPIIVLISGKAEHGKDAFADAFIKEAGDKQGFRCLRIKYGDKLKFVCVPDCRFPNELEWDDTPFFFFTVRVARLNEDGTQFSNHLTEEQKLHPSETALDEWKFNYTVESKTLEDLSFAAESILKDMLKVDEENNVEG